MKQLALYLAIAGLAAGCASSDRKTDAPVTDRSGGSSTSQPSQAGSGGSAAAPPGRSSPAASPATRCATRTARSPSAACFSTTTPTR